MSVISEALDDVFAESDLMKGAFWREQGVGAERPVQIWLSEPDLELRLGSTRAIVGSHLIDVRMSDVAEPCEDDTVRVGAAIYRIVGGPRRDERGIVWNCEAVLQPS